MARVEELGGAVAAIEKGFQKAEIERSAYQVAQRDRLGRTSRRRGQQVRIGDRRAYAPLRVDPAIEHEQADAAGHAAGGRDDAEVAPALDDVKRAAAGRDNLLYPLRAALRGQGYGR